MTARRETRPRMRPAGYDGPRAQGLPERQWVPSLSIVRNRTHRQTDERTMNQPHPSLGAAPTRLPHSRGGRARRALRLWLVSGASEHEFGGGGTGEARPVGASLQLTGRHVAAAEHFRAYLAIPEHPRVTPALRAKAQGYLGEVIPFLGHVSLDVPLGAAVTVDGKLVVGTMIDVEPGPHTVAAKVGERSSYVNVTVVAGATVPAHVEIGATAVVVAPVAVVPSPTVTPPPIEPPPPPLTQPGSWWTTRREVGVAVAGVGVVGLVLGGVFGGERGGDTSSASTAATALGPSNAVCFHSTSSSCGSLANSLQSNGSADSLEIGFLVGGGVLLAAGVATTFWPVSNDSHASALLPSVGPHSAGFSWTGTF